MLACLVARMFGWEEEEEELEAGCSGADGLRYCV